MARWVAMVVVALAPMLGPLFVPGFARADATLACNFKGKNVQVLITNSKDGPRSCNAECVWRATNIPFRGTGGAQLDAGEAKTAFRGQAPMPVTSVYSHSLTCDR
ncbi:MAG: hypothetical protein JO021_13045 [Alphaproteobacteria bacterium]|nr:hypothetical protein [Alphaproteobacteria bacterium]